jgi:hypothetical protein
MKGKYVETLRVCWKIICTFFPPHSGEFGGKGLQSGRIESVEMFGRFPGKKVSKFQWRDLE